MDDFLRIENAMTRIEVAVSRLSARAAAGTVTEEFIARHAALKAQTALAVTEIEELIVRTSSARVP